MASKSNLAGKFISATKQFPKNITGAPWNLFRNMQVAYDDKLYAHAFRKGTMPTTVKLYSTILRAVEMYMNVGALPYRDAPHVLMVSKNAVAKDAKGNAVKCKEYALELLWPDGTSTVMTKKQNDIRISDIETDGTNNPICEFKSLDEYRMAAIYLLCLPEILESDSRIGGNKLSQMMNEQARFIPDYASWRTEADIPDLAKESAFFMDAVFCYANDTAEWQFADPTTNPTAVVAEQVSTDMLRKGFTGASVCCSDPNVAFVYVKSNGSTDGGSVRKMTIAEAKAKFSEYTSHRVWTKAEQMMIPQFADDMPVMPETIRLAKRILGTRNAVNPMKNAMWRGVTAYGKSTGVRQLACILNIPLLILTCHPGMEISEFKSTFVPESEEDAMEMRVESVALNSEATIPMTPELQAVISHVSKMEQQEREAFLSGTGFYMTAVMDTDSAAYSLFGKDMVVEMEDLCKLYSDTVCYFREKPLRLKIAQMDNDEPTEAPKEEKKPGFKHVISPYLKALVNGYMVEVQEPSRIRDSGVLVGLNEYEHAGAVIHMMNGAQATRHPDAICLMTDNVGYASCRPIDPSVLRRQGMIIDSPELSEDLLKDRVRRNTGCADEHLLTECFELWKKVKEYCETNSITEGSVSPMELERLVQAVMLDGDDSLEDNLDDCVISKATSSIDDQRDIRTAIQSL